MYRAASERPGPSISVLRPHGFAGLGSSAGAEDLLTRTNRLRADLDSDLLVFCTCQVEGRPWEPRMSS